MGPIFVILEFLFDFQIIEFWTLFLACPDTYFDSFETTPGGIGTIEFPSGDKDYEANLNCLVKVSLPEGTVYILGN